MSLISQLRNSQRKEPCEWVAATPLERIERAHAKCLANTQDLWNLPFYKAYPNFVHDSTYMPRVLEHCRGADLSKITNLRCAVIVASTANLKFIFYAKVERQGIDLEWYFAWDPIRENWTKLAIECDLIAFAESFASSWPDLEARAHNVELGDDGLESDDRLDHNERLEPDWASSANASTLSSWIISLPAEIRIAIFWDDLGDVAAISLRSSTSFQVPLNGNNSGYTDSGSLGYIEDLGPKSTIVADGSRLLPLRGVNKQFYMDFVAALHHAAQPCRHHILAISADLTTKDRNELQNTHWPGELLVMLFFHTTPSAVEYGHACGSVLIIYFMRSDQPLSSQIHPLAFRVPTDAPTFDRPSLDVYHTVLSCQSLSVRKDSTDPSKLQATGFMGLWELHQDCRPTLVAFLRESLPQLVHTVGNTYSAGHKAVDKLLSGLRLEPVISEREAEVLRRTFSSNGVVFTVPETAMTKFEPWTTRLRVWYLTSRTRWKRTLRKSIVYTCEKLILVPMLVILLLLCRTQLRTNPLSSARAVLWICEAVINIAFGAAVASVYSREFRRLLPINVEPLTISKVLHLSTLLHMFVLVGLSYLGHLAAVRPSRLENLLIANTGDRDVLYSLTVVM